MQDGNRDVGRAPQLGQYARRTLPDRRHPHPSPHGLLTPDHHAWRGEAGDAHPNAAADDDDIGSVGKRVGGKAANVAAHVAEGRRRDRPLQYREPIVEVVIARRRDVVADRVHHVDHRVRLARHHPRVIVGERLAFDQVARVHHNHAPGIAPLERVDDGGSPRETPRKRPVGHIVPLGGVTVDVCGGNEDEVGGVGARRE